MKKIFSIIFIVVMAGISFSQSLSGIKICIDPGHGGHDAANDRFIPIPNFWESEGNWYKAGHVKQILEELGAEVYVTRNGNNDSDDLSLSSRAAIANANNVDFFQSIHSNATGTSTRVNYPLMLFRGYDDAPVFPEAKTYSQIAFDEFLKANRGRWIYSYKNVRGDWSFYPSWGTSGLGVLRPLAMPGILSEGSFHDYIPEAFRLKNDSYLRHEAWAIARTFINYFNKAKVTHGIIAGIVRDPNEKVPTNYQALAGTKDNLKPVNSIKVTLEPGGKEYIGDDFNNGYYFFDYLEPGNYKVYLDVAGYQKDSASLTVTAQNSVFADKELNLIPNFNAPQIMSYSPADSSTEVSNLSPIKIEFDIKMDVVSVQSAFSITPPVAGTFSWAKNDMELSFIPNTSFTAGATYTVIVSAAAKTFFHIALDQPLSFSFTTRAKLNLVDHYPFNNEEDVSKTVVVKLFFDFAIESASLPGNILFYDKDNKFVSLVVNQSAYSKGMIEFEPNVPLKAGEYYRVILKPGIGDIEKVKLQEDREITFRVENTSYSGGNVLFDFESLTGIIAPQANVFSKGIDTENTSLVITGTKKVDGSNSALLDYKFISDTAEVFIDFQTPKEFAVGAGTEFGVWVFGDLSKNLIKYHLINSQNESFFIDVDTLDFTGWKFKSIKISDSGISGTVKFKGIVISKSSAGSNVGSIFFDNAQYDFTTPVSYERPIEKIYTYSLVGNYPNPFNPSTKIKFTIPETADVSLVVFNLLGEEVVSILKDEKFNAGEYTVDWNAANNKGAKVPSGVYFYELRTEKFRAVKKMLLIR